MSFMAALAPMQIGATIGAKQDADKRARRNKKLRDIFILEQERRQLREDQRIVGRGNAAIYASGIRRAGSAGNYMNEMESQLKNEREFEKRRALLQSNITKQDDKDRATTAMIGGLFSIAGSAAGANLKGTTGWTK